MLNMSPRHDDHAAPRTRKDMLLARLSRVCELVQLDDRQRSRAVVSDFEAIIADLERLGLGELAEVARDGLAEAWRWHLGTDPVDARIRVARLARTVWRSLGTAWPN